MTLQTARELLLAFPGVEEAPCYGTPGFRVAKKLIARAWEDGETLVLRVDPYERDSLLAAHPDTLFLTGHYRNYPFVLARLPVISPDDLEALVEQAWRLAAPKRLLAQRGTAT